MPLAPYEVFHPWWGRGFYGGPGYINHSINIVSVNVTNVYRNSRVVNGFTAVSGADFRSGRFNTFVRPSAAELTQASFARGPLPVTPNSTNLRYSDRQTAFMPRSTAPARVFSYRQQGSGTLPNRSLDPPSAGRTQGGWTRFGAPVGQSTAPSGSGSIGRNESGRQRFGESRPTPSAEPVAQRGWSRFGEPYAGPRQSYAPQVSAESPRNPGSNQFSQSKAPASLRVAPPVVRERQSNPGNFGGPTAGAFPGPRGGLPQAGYQTCGQGPRPGRSPLVRDSILGYFRDENLPFATRGKPKEWTETVTALDKLRASPAKPRNPAAPETSLKPQ